MARDRSESFPDAPPGNFGPNDWNLLLELTRKAASQRRIHLSAIDHAKRSTFASWAATGNFIADREPLDFRTWRYLQQIYEAVPQDPSGLDMVIMKSAQGGASIFALLLSLWLMLRGRYQLAYFLPTWQLAQQFSRDRFIKLARENRQIHRLMGKGSGFDDRSVDEGSAAVRRILHSIAYFTHIGGKVTTEALPLDAIMFDEVQEMLLVDMEKAQERLSASPLHVTLRLSTANFAGADIHHYYERSDQREFHTHCRCPGGIVLADCWDPRNGPTCIGQGNGSTPGVPAEPFYVCPRCGEIIRDPQDGVFRAKNPGASRIGFHFPQMLSPRVTAARILDKWESRNDTKNFFNRVLGRPYADPDTMPVSEHDLRACENHDLRWGPLAPGSSKGVFMGIDQMGHENYVVIKARLADRLQLLHLEVIQAQDPWTRCAELMRNFRVRHAVVETLPNFNEAHRFAREFPGRVFLASYQDHADEILQWGDRPRDGVSVRSSDESFRTPWTVSVDQFKMMSRSLAMWHGREIQTPDSRGLHQEIRTRRGLQPVAICRDLFWLHLQRVALVTEEAQGRENERRLRRAVKKVGIDPHFAFANMLCDVALARAFGTSRILFSDKREGRPVDEKPQSALAKQFEELYPDVYYQMTHRTSLTCGDCVHFQPQRQWCGERDFRVGASQPSCDFFIPRSDDDDDEGYD